MKIKTKESWWFYDDDGRYGRRLNYFKDSSVLDEKWSLIFDEAMLSEKARKRIFTARSRGFTVLYNPYTSQVLAYDPESASTEDT